jgi:hypothetical protein
MTRRTRPVPKQRRGDGRGPLLGNLDSLWPSPTRGHLVRSSLSSFRVARYPAGALKGGPKMSVNAARPGRIYRSDQNVGPNNLPGQCPTWRLRVRVDHFRLPTMRTGSRQQPCPVLPTIQEQKCSDFRYLSFSGSNLPPPYSLSAGSHIIGPARLNLCISGLFRVCSRSLPASFP